MKTIFAIILAFLVTLALPADELFAQTKAKPTATSLGYLFNMHPSKDSTSVVSKHFASAQSDTSETIHVGYAKAITFALTPVDTASLDYYVQYLVVGTNTSWTTALTDSLINTGVTSNTGKTQEYIFRNHTVEKYGGLNFQVRTVKVFRGSGNGVTSAFYTEKVNYVP